MTASSLLMELTADVPTMAGPSLATSLLRRVDYDTKLLFASKQVTSYGSTALAYPAGKWPDINIFRASLLSHLGNYERVEADDGYIGEAPQYVKCPKSFTNLEETEFMQQRVRNRQETANKRFKDWAALQTIFRHDILLHADVFRLVVIVTQLKINGGEKLFACGYKDPPF